MKNYLAVDLGATSGRVILATVEDGKISQETLLRFPTPLIEREGKYYWDINDLFDNIVKGLAVAGERGLEVESIGVDTWGVDFVLVAKDGSVSLPRAYRDPYTDGIPAKFFEQMPREELYRRTGIQIMNFNSVFQLYAQTLEGSQALKEADSILFMPDAISYLLTGQKVCEYTILSTSAVMDPRTKTIDPEILAICGVKPEQFPQVVFPGHVIGELKPEIAERTGLKGVKVIAVAGHDTGSAVAAVPAQDECFAYLSSGTWSLMGIETKNPVINEKMAELNFTNEGGVGGTTRLLKNITGMWLLEQCIKVWKAEGKQYKYDEIHAMAKASKPSAHLIDPDAPEFAAPTNMPKTICEYQKARGFEAPANDGEMARLIYDSLSAKYADVLGKLKEIADFPINVLHIIGGGSQNLVLDQMTANACGIKVVAGPGEGTALGNVMIQAGISRPELLKSVETKTFIPEK